MADELPIEEIFRLRSERDALQRRADRYAAEIVALTKRPDDRFVQMWRRAEKAEEERDELREALREALPVLEDAIDHCATIDGEERATARWQRAKDLLAKETK